MTFVNDNGEVLDFDGDFAITKRAVSFFNSKIQGDYSINFQVDNNSVNRKVLGYDGPQMTNQVAFTRQSFTLMRNGNPYMKGFIVIQNDNGDTLSCFFISGNANWLNLLNGLITELDYSGVTNVTNYELQLTATNVNTRMSATSGIIFPLVDWCYDLNKGGNEWFVANLKDIRQDSYQSYFEWYPCFYLKTLVSEIMIQKGLKIDGNILDDKLYQSLALTPFNGEMKRDNVNVTTAYGTSQVNTSGADVQYVNLTEASDPDSAFSAGSYTAVRSSKIIITLTIVTLNVTGGIGLAIVGLRKNGGSIAAYTVGPLSVGQGTYVVETSGVSGDVFQVYFNDTANSTSITLTANVKFEIPTAITVNDYIRPEKFLPPLSCLDVIKFIVSYFGCAVYYNEYSKTITVNIIEKIKQEDAPDWSAYFLSRKVNYTEVSAANNYIRLQPSEDTEIKAYDKAHIVKFGEGNITTDNTIKETNELFKIPFAASEFGLGKNGDWLTNIPLVQVQDSGEPIVYTSIVNEPPRAGYTFTNGPTLAAGQAVRIVDDVSGDIGVYIVASFSVGVSSVAIFHNIQFQQTGTGKLYPQERTFQTLTPRLLVVKPETSFTDISSIDTTYNLRDDTYAASSKSSIGLGYFCKSATGLTVDTMKANAAIENPDIDTFTDPGVKDLYFEKIGHILGNPSIPVMLLLPEAVFQAFKFDSFIYLKTASLTGYFWVESISNYQDSTTPVQVNLLMI